MRCVLCQKSKHCFFAGARQEEVSGGVFCPQQKVFVGSGRLRPEFCFEKRNVVGDTSEGLQPVASEERDSVPKVSTTAWLVE